MTTDQKRVRLENRGFIVGLRNPQLNTNFPGEFMVVESYTLDQLPTVDGRDGPWCIVGDDLNELIEQAYDVHQDELDPLTIPEGELVDYDAQDRRAYREELNSRPRPSEY